MTITPSAPLDLSLDLLGGDLITGGFPSVAPLDLVLDLLGGDLYAVQPPTVTPDALRVAIVDHTGTVLVPDVPKRTGLSGSVEQDTSGSVTLTVGLQDFEDGPDDLLDARNLIRVSFGDLDIAEALMDSAPPVQDDAGNWSYQINGRGSFDILDNGVLYPEVRADTEDRQFDYGSRVVPYGGWYNAGQWFTPKSRNVRTSFRWTFRKRHYPKGWPETHARWLWSMNPELGSPPGPRYFRGSVTVASTRRVRVWAAGDDTLTLKIDGNVIFTGAPGAWRKAKNAILTLEAGTHIVAAKVSNLTTAGSPGKNRSGFLFAMGQLATDGSGDIVKWLLRSHPNNFVVTSGPTPGWFPPTVMIAHIIEGRNRLVDRYADIDMAFTSAHDTDGLPWVTRRDMSIPIGSAGTEVAAQIAAHGYSFAMKPGLRLCCWRYRGRDLRDFVHLGQVETAGYTSRVWSRVKTWVLVHAAYGWRTYESPRTGLNTVYGRREMMFSGGNARSADAAQSQGQGALRDVGTPEETIEVTTHSTAGPQPFRDYDIADIVMVATRTGYVSGRVKAISFNENTDKTVTWTTTLYPFATPVDL